MLLVEKASNRTVWSHAEWALVEKQRKKWKLLLNTGSYHTRNEYIVVLWSCFAVLLHLCCCCGPDQRAVERLAVTLVKPQKAPTCTRTRKVRRATSSAATTSDPALTCDLSRPADSTPEQTPTRDAEDAEAAENNPEDPRSADARARHSHNSPLHRIVPHKYATCSRFS